MIRGVLSIEAKEEPLFLTLLPLTYLPTEIIVSDFKVMIEIKNWHLLSKAL